MKYSIKLKNWYVGIEKWEDVHTKNGKISYLVFEKKIHIPSLLLQVFFVLFIVFLMAQKYKACMQIFNSFWYCALSK